MTIGDQDFIWNGWYWEEYPTPTPAPIITSVEPNAVPTNSGPQTITITGTNLCGLSSMTLDADGTQYPVMWTGDGTTLTFQVPSAALNIAGAGTMTLFAGSTSGGLQEIGAIWRGQPAQPTVQPNTGVLRQFAPLPVTEGMWQRGGAGTGLLVAPASIAAANTAVITGVLEDGVSPTNAAWPTGTFITFADASEGHWNGTTWVAGRSP